MRWATARAGLIEPLKADVVATGNPGSYCKCKPRWRAADIRFPWYTQFKLVDASIRGESIEFLKH